MGPRSCRRGHAGPGRQGPTESPSKSVGPREIAVDGLQLYRVMVRIRRFEERVEELFLAGKLPGFVHLSIGQEAVPAGVCAHLTPEDYVTSTHRGHGHAIAKGMDLGAMMAELYGKRAGSCRGKGGSMHIFDARLGMLGANGIVCAGVPIAAGAALAARLLGQDRVAVAFLGDGATARGPFHETLNLASLWKLPVVLVVEQNAYASTTAYEEAHAFASVAEFVRGYGVAAQRVDGNDVEAVYRAAGELVARARSGRGPGLLEAVTYRLRGHYVGDPQRYRAREEVQAAQERDPIRRWREVLRSRGVPEEALQTVESEEAARVEQAVRFAEESPLPEPEEALEELVCEPEFAAWERAYRA